MDLSELRLKSNYLIISFIRVRYFKMHLQYLHNDCCKFNRNKNFNNYNNNQTKKQKKYF